MRRVTEQRWNFRKQFNTRVILDVWGLGAVQGETRDVGYGGMRLDTRPWVLSPNTKVRVTFVSRQETEDTPRSIDARVTYMNRDGCGLTFEEFHRDTFAFLHTLIHLEAQAVSPQREGAVARA
jgi:hypothetical protein